MSGSNNVAVDLNSTPPWLRWTGDFIAKVGVPAAICAALLWIMAGKLDKIAESSQAQVQQHERMIQLMEAHK